MKSGLLRGLGPGAKDKLRFFIMSIFFDMFWYFWRPVTLGGGQGNCPFTVLTHHPPSWWPYIKVYLNCVQQRTFYIGLCPESLSRISTK